MLNQSRYSILAKMNMWGCTAGMRKSYSLPTTR
nr:MAG TPA: hypothetical protein [Caudoviricetes sp.]